MGCAPQGGLSLHKSDLLELSRRNRVIPDYGRCNSQNNFAGLSSSPSSRPGALRLRSRIVRIMTERGARRLDLSRKLLLSVAGLVAVAVPVTFGLVLAAQSRAQSQDVPQWQTAAGGKMEFKTATVRQSKPGTFTPPNFALDDGDAYGSADPHGRFSVRFRQGCVTPFESPC